MTGTLSDPAVGIEPKRLARRVLGALALGAAAGPAAAVLPLLESGSVEAKDPCNPPAAAGSKRSSSPSPSTPAQKPR
ncbi:hypothetical protein FQZ97_1245390 [compost metagenome]